MKPYVFDPMSRFTRYQFLHPIDKSVRHAFDIDRRDPRKAGSAVFQVLLQPLQIEGLGKRRLSFSWRTEDVEMGRHYSENI